MPPLPPITQALILINVAMFCLQQIFEHLSGYLALWPIGPHLMPWQVVTYAFLHGSMPHIMFNMLGLWMFGVELELKWGPRKYLQMYFASLLTAAVAQLLVASLFKWTGPTIGASGAVFGLLVAYAMVFSHRQFDLVGFVPMVLLMMPGQLFYTLGIVLYVMLVMNRQAVPIPPIMVPARIMIMIFGAIELLAGVFFWAGGIAHFAHLGGMLGGWLMIRYWRGQTPFGGR